jgi:hypothetical protein
LTAIKLSDKSLKSSLFNFTRSEKMRKSIIWFSLLLVAFVISTCFNITPASAQAVDPPNGIHLTWQSNDTARTVTITWKTDNENVGDVVRYGTEPGGYGSPVVGSHHTYSGAGGYIHDVELTGLSPDTTYYFICGGENGGWSEEREFKTAPAASGNIRFVAGGDSRSGASDWPLGRDNISRTMAKFNPSFALFIGDFAYNWNLQTEWDNWFAATQEYWVDNNGSTIPIIPCIGNHEVYYPQPSDYDPETQATNYYEQFYLPGNERWYSLDWGPNLHIIVLDSEIRSRSSAWEEQLSWLEDDLATHASCRWKIAMYHEPSFTKSRHYSNSLTREDWVPLFDNYHVDLVISGHNHCYERTDPINYTESKENVMLSPAEGTIYVTAGAGGAPLYSDNRQDWWTGYGPVAKYSFVVVDIFDNGTLHLQAVDTDGATFDEYYIYKEVPAPGGELPIVAIVVSAVIIACAGAALYILRMRGKS